MNKNEPLNNLSQYKYAYKIYMANNKLNSEKVNLIYCNKNCIVILDGDNVRTISSSVIYLEEELDSAIKDAINHWEKYRFVDSYFILLRNKMESSKIKEITENKEAKIAVLKKEIESQRNETERLRRYIKGHERTIERLEKRILSLELELSELLKETGE